jgi:LysR family transcriptional regulator, glycine cleavage system transcriptional activator
MAESVQSTARLFAARQGGGEMDHDRFPSFGGLKSFYALALTGSAVKAAARLGVSPSSISHQVKALEKEMGVRLVVNNKGRLLLTAKGEQYFDAIRSPLRGILQATDAIRSMPGRRRVSLTLTPSFAAGWLLPLLQDAKAKHPDVELDLIATTRVVDLARENVDLAIRRGGGKWPDCVAEPLMREVLVPVVAPAIWKTLGCNTIEQAFGATRVLVNTTMPAEWDQFCEARGFASPQMESRFNLETYELTVQAARDGLGIALGRRPLVDNLLQSGELIAPAGNSGHDLHGYFVVRLGGEMRSDVRRLHAWLLSHRR